MSQRRYLNNSNLSMFAQVYLATDYYDKESAGLSVTTLIKPIRQTILAKRVPPEAMLIDVTANIPNRNGAAIHDGFERAWKSPNLPEVLASLGMPPGMARKIRVNPSPEEVAKGGILPVYTELRSSIIIDGVKVTGQFDFIGGGQLEDLKNTSTYKYMNTDGEEYILQGSMYRLMNMDKVTKDQFNVTFNFTNWDSGKARSTEGYPPEKMLTKRYQLMTPEATKEWASGRIALLLKYMNAKEEDIPYCTDKELWRGDPVYAYYKKAADAHVYGKRSTKNFAIRREADTRLYADGGTGVVVERPAEVKACKYCSAFMACTQKDALIASGDLVL